VEGAITMIRKIVFDFQTVIPNAQLIINLLSLVSYFSISPWEAGEIRTTFSLIFFTWWKAWDNDRKKI